MEGATLEGLTELVLELQARVKSLESYSMGLEKSYSETLEENDRLRKVVDAARKYADMRFDTDLAKAFHELDAPPKGVTSPSEGVDGENKELPENVCQWCLEKNCTVC